MKQDLVLVHLHFVDATKKAMNDLFAKLHTETNLWEKFMSLSCKQVEQNLLICIVIKILPHCYQYHYHSQVDITLFFPDA